MTLGILPPKIFAVLNTYGSHRYDGLENVLEVVYDGFPSQGLFPAFWVFSEL